MSLDWAKAVDKILKDGEEKNAPAPSVAAAVPAAAASIGQQVPVVAALPPVHHIVVQPGDNLHSIAQQQLGQCRPMVADRGPQPGPQPKPEPD